MLVRIPGAVWLAYVPRFVGPKPGRTTGGRGFVLIVMSGGTSTTDLTKHSSCVVQFKNRCRAALGKLFFAHGALVCLLPTCGEPARIPPPEPGPTEVEAAPPSDPAPVDEPPPARLTLGVEVDHPSRWLQVEKIHGDAAGAWATGSFDPRRNKLDIRTEDVAQFTIDVSRIPIRWDRLVVIRIDGSNSELVRRDYAVYRFARDDHGQWVVAEREKVPG